MTAQAWLFALALTLPIAALALLAGRKAAHEAGYWTMALILIVLPLGLAPVLPWLALSAPTALDPLMPVLGVAQTLPGVGTRVASDPVAAVDWAVLGVAIWGVGALIRGGNELWKSYRLSQMTAEADPAGAQLQARVRALAAEMGVNPAGIHTHAGPVIVTGLIHTRLYLNAAALSSPACDQIIRHELAHIARFDVLMLCLARLIGVALWFNPFVFAVEHRRRLAAELDCDRRSLAGPRSRSARLYARALLDAAGSNSGSSSVVGFGVAPRKAIEMRLTSILTPTPKPRKRRTLARMLTLGIAVSLLSGVQAAQANGHLQEPDFTEVILEGRNTSGFGPRVIEGLDVPPFHGGHDIAAPLGTPIRAPASGVITYSGDEFRGNGNWGYVVEIDHGGGWTTIYAHLSGSMFNRGDRVEAGQIFATVGNTGLSTGPHLHVEVRQNGERRNPVDYLPGLATPAN